MGLDMYINRVKRVENVTFDDIETLDSYFGYLERDDKFKKDSMKKYCGIKESDVRKDLIPLYYKEYIPRYPNWDEKKEYPHNCLYQNMAYWRKANAIHNFFVKEVQGGVDDCNSYEISKDAFKELLRRCRKIIRTTKMVDGKITLGTKFENGQTVPIIEDGKVFEDTSVAEKLLPVQEGFFFGSTQYNEYYMDMIKYTRDVVSKILKDENFDNYMYVYRASW